MTAIRISPTRYAFRMAWRQLLTQDGRIELARAAGRRLMRLTASTVVGAVALPLMAVAYPAVADPLFLPAWSLPDTPQELLNVMRDLTKVGAALGAGSVAGLSPLVKNTIRAAGLSA